MLLRMSDISKSFSGVYALRGVDLDVKAGECLALVGENGAGKSTLMKILSGVWPHGSFGGSFQFVGKSLALHSPLEARQAGISIIHQELCLFPDLTVAENLFLTEAAPYEGEASRALFSRVDWKTLTDRAEKLFQSLGFNIPYTANVSSLSVAERQLVEIARAFHQKAKLLILDEPTSALSLQEVEHLFNVVERLKGQVTFIYISHKLDEVFRLCDRIVVLRDGQSVGSLNTDAVTEADVIHHMVGRAVSLEPKSNAKKGSSEKALSVSRLTHVDNNQKILLDDISFEVSPGEVLGISGLMGAGRSELLRSIVGVLPGKRSGEVQVQQRKVEWKTIEDAMKDGVVFLPEDRKKDGLFLDHPIDFNMTISSLNSLTRKLGMIDSEQEQSISRKLARKIHLKFSRFEDSVKVLSGGNQQKVLFAKGLARNPRVLFLDEPTRGIDVGAKEEIYALIRELVADGLAVVMVSSELPEVLAISDRVLVLREGRLVANLFNKDLTQERIMSFAAGGSHAIAN